MDQTTIAALTVLSVLLGAYTLGPIAAFIVAAFVCGLLVRDNQRRGP
jgi:biotin transporter BioY